MSKLKTRQYLIIFVFVAAFLERTVFNLGENIELITTAAILGSFYLGTKKTFLLTFLIVAVSDLVIGNTNIFLFTWSGFLLPTLVIPMLIRNSKFKIKNSVWKTAVLMGTGVFSNLFFFIHTNFGVWLLDAWGMYSKDFAGLITCYIRALPFLKNQLLSSIIFIPIGYFAIKTLPSVIRFFPGGLNAKIKPIPSN